MWSILNIHLYKLELKDFQARIWSHVLTQVPSFLNQAISPKRPCSMKSAGKASRALGKRLVDYPVLNSCAKVLNMLPTTELQLFFRYFLSLQYNSTRITKACNL